MESIRLDATNVLVVLQRAEREKSEAVVNDCVHFLRVNLQQMVTTSGGEMSDLSEDVIRKLVHGCHHADIEALKDKADRIRSRLFRHITERLLEPEAKPDLGSPESAANVFRCSVCSRLLHQRTATRVKCQPGHFSVDKYGGLVPKHTRNEQWSAKLHVKALFFRRKSWRHVYWKLWSDIHFLECVKCATHFPCSQMSWCAYHPLAAKFATTIGQFPCCQRRASRFDPWELNDKGCRYREHVVNPSNPTSLSVHREFVCHREIIAASNADTSASWHKSRYGAAYSETLFPPDQLQLEAVTVDVPKDVPLDSPTSKASANPLADVIVQRARRRPRSDTDAGRIGVRTSDGRIIGDDGDDSSTSTSSSSSGAAAASSSDNNGRTSEGQVSSTDDDDDGSSNSSSSESRGAYGSKKSTPLWDASKSRRQNHDVLRDIEQRRFREMVDELMVCRPTAAAAVHNSQSSTMPSLVQQHLRSARSQQHQQKREQVGHPAGIYGRLEGEWKASRASAAAAALEAAGAAAPSAPSFSFRGPRMTSVLAVAKFKQTKKINN